jgi:hypothetical protein
MQTVSDIEPRLIDLSVVEAAVPAPAVRWRLTTRLAFRFFSIYCLFYVLMTQMLPGMLPVPGINFIWLGTFGPLQNGVRWVARSVFGFGGQLAAFGGSGDKAYDWTLAFCLLVGSATLTLLWSALDRRPAHPALFKWFRLFMRFALAGTMASYGLAKAIPNQMQYPSLLRLIEPYGFFSMMGVLWAQIGASPAYEIVTGFVELAAAVLLIIPGLTLAGALLSLLASTHVFILNMTYDVPVKLFSLHLVVMALVLLAPDMKRLLHLVVLDRPTASSSQQPIFRRRALQRVLIVAQLALGGWIVWSNYSESMNGYRTFGAGAPRPPLYGLWDIERMTIDGVERSPLITDYGRWRRVVIQRANGISFQRMDDTTVGYGARTSEDQKTITLLGAPNTPSPGTLRVNRPAEDRLVLEGDVGGKKIRMEAKKNDLRGYRLLQSRFRWIQEAPFNR